MAGRGSVLTNEINEAQAIICAAQVVEIELLIEAPLGGDWMYQWRISLSSRAGFAICNPYRDDAIAGMRRRSYGTWSAARSRPATRRTSRYSA